jgi:hypothetical protein
MVEHGITRGLPVRVVFHALVVLLGLLALLTLLSLRSVWPLMNGYVVKVLPLGGYAFSAALAAFLVIPASTFAAFVYALIAKGRRKARFWPCASCPLGAPPDEQEKPWCTRFRAK